MSNADRGAPRQPDEQEIFIGFTPLWMRVQESLRQVLKSTWFRAALLLVVLGAGGVAVRKLQIRHRIAGYRTAGLAAAKAGDAARAVDLLGRYLSRFPQDTEALAAYCQMRPKLPDTDGRNVADTIGALRRLLAVDPANIAQRRELMRLLMSIGSHVAACDEADHLLGQLPGNAEALGVRTRSLLARRQLERAVEADQKWQRAGGFDLASELEILSLMRETGTPDAEIVSRCGTLLSGHELDPRYMVLAVHGYSLGGNYDPPMQSDLLKQAARRFAADDTLAKDGALAAAMARQLDDHGRFDESIAVLSRWAAISRQAAAAWALGTRLFLAGRWEQACAAFGVAGDQMPPDALAIMEICAARAGHAQEAAAARAALSQRGGEVAAAWNAIASWATALQPHSASQASALLETARKTQGNSIAAARESAAVWAYFRGDAEAALGETDLALEAWRHAIGFAPAWAEPVVRSVPMLSDAGRWRQALEMADEANRRAPGTLAVASMFAQAWALALDHTQPGGTAGPENGTESESHQRERLLQFVDGLLKQAPNDEPVLCVRIGLLARQESTKAQAKAGIDAALAKTPAPSTATCLRLAAISSASGLDREEACLSAAERTARLRPAIALARSTILARSGKAAAARAAMDAAVAQHAKETASGKDSDGVEWEACRAMYLDQAGDPDAGAALAKLADGHPASLVAQRTALHSRAAANDLALMTRALDRVRQLTGERGLEWQVARARVLLAGTPPSPAALQEAKKLLDDSLKLAPQCVDAHALQARWCEATFDLEGASREWSTAAGLAPGVPRVVMAYARFLRERNNVQGAAQALAWLYSQLPVEPEERAHLAMLLADCGQLSRAIEIMEQSSPASSSQPSDQTPLVLGELYRRGGRAQDAERAYQRVASTPTLSSIVFTADRLAAQGKDSQAQALLDSLASLQLPVGTSQLAMADHILRFKGAEAAIPAYRNACHAAPQNAATWKGLIACCVEAGRPVDAVSAADAGAAAAPTDEALLQLHAHPDLLSLAASQLDLRGLGPALIQNPAEGGPTVRAIRETQVKETPVAVAARIDSLADAFPALLPLQRLSFSRDVEVQQVEHAIALADRTAGMFPTLPEPCGWQFAAQATAGHWKSALAAAEQWRQRSLFAAPSQLLNAQVAQAQALLRLGRAADAVAALETYCERALADPRTSSQWFRMYVIACGELPEKLDAAKLGDRLRPLLQNPAGREVWIGLAADMNDPADAFTWLDLATQAVPAEDAPSRLALGTAWLGLWSRRPGPECLARADAALAPLLSRPQPSPRALLTAAIVSHQAGNLPAAEAGYRRVLSLREGDDLAAVQPIADNNLANLLAQRAAGGSELDEALDLARDAVSANADAGSFHDTLAAVYSKRRQFGLAVIEWRNAARLAPGATRYRVRLAQALADEDDVAAARETAQKLLTETAATPLQQDALTDAERRQLSMLSQLPDPGTPDRKDAVPK